MQASRLQRFHWVTWCIVAWGIFAFSISGAAFGQGQQYQSSFSTQRNQTATTSTPSMKYFGNSVPGRARMYSPRREFPAPQPVQIAGAKPFQTLQRGATLSPYLGLDIRTSELSIPNYYAFVRPQQQLQNSNKAQSEQVRRLKQRLRMSNSREIVSSNPSGGIPTTGHSSQFLNMGSYFPAPQ